MAKTKTHQLKTIQVTDREWTLLASVSKEALFALLRHTIQSLAPGHDPGDWTATAARQLTMLAEDGIVPKRYRNVLAKADKARRQLRQSLRKGREETRRLLSMADPDDQTAA